MPELPPGLIRFFFCVCFIHVVELRMWPYTVCSHFPKSTRWILNSSVSLSLSPDYTDLVRKLGGKMNFQEFSILICVTISFSPWLLLHSISLPTGIKTNKKCISAARFTQFCSIVWLKINLNLPKKIKKNPSVDLAPRLNDMQCF